LSIDSADSYISYLENDPEAHRLLSTIPWVLDTALQGEMLRTLKNEAARMNELCPRTKFSIITPMYSTNPRFLSELIFSCKAQTWWNWELILFDDGSPKKEHLSIAQSSSETDARIKYFSNPTNKGISEARNQAIQHASGDFICLLDHDDLLHPQALGVFARNIHKSPQSNFFYSNEVKINSESTLTCEFLSKPSFDAQTLLRINYIAHFTCIKRELLDLTQSTSGHLFNPQFDGVEDHDFFLRVSEQQGFSPIHIPLFCYYWRKSETSTAASLDNKPNLGGVGREMLQETFKRRQQNDIEIGSPAAFGKNRFFAIHRVPSKSSLVVIVPFKDEPATTISCLEHLESQKTNLKLNVVLVNNNSQNDSLESIKKWLSKPRNFDYTLSDHNGPFNYAVINNTAVKKFAGDAKFVLFLNNDVDLTSKNALDAMAGELENDENIGFVGIKLWYPGKLEVQHGGIKVRPAIVGSGYHQIGHISSDGEFAHDEHSVMAVTFACAMVKHTTLKKLGYLEEEFFPNGFGDVDINLKALEAGLTNFYLGTISGIHHESKTRTPSSEDLEFANLHLHHFAAIQDQRVNQLAYDLHVIWSQMDLQSTQWRELPMRYRVADKINNSLKSKLAPFHRIIKFGAKKL